MRRSFAAEVEAGREGGLPGTREGAFRLRCPATRAVLTVLASDGSRWEAELLPGRPWEHVSVSAPHRCPTWDEMDWVKRLFWDDDETVLQLHVPRARHINLHPFVLHLWRPTGLALPLPPQACV